MNTNPHYGNCDKANREQYVPFQSGDKNRDWSKSFTITSAWNQTANTTTKSLIRESRRIRSDVKLALSIVEVWAEPTIAARFARWALLIARLPLFFYFMLFFKDFSTWSIFFAEIWRAQRNKKIATTENACWLSRLLISGASPALQVNRDTKSWTWILLYWYRGSQRYVIICFFFNSF